jgi:hypothetical protein
MCTFVVFKKSTLTCTWPGAGAAGVCAACSAISCNFSTGTVFSALLALVVLGALAAAFVTVDSVVFFVAI